jgi:hypothetical protein
VTSCDLVVDKSRKRDARERTMRKKTTVAMLGVVIVALCLFA